MFYDVMQIRLIQANIKNNNPIVQKKRKPFSTSPLALLARDTVTFGAMKKTQFNGIDLAVVEKFKAPIEKFNSNEDFQNWASLQVKKIIQTDFGGRYNEINLQRKAMLKEWADYVLKENNAYNNAVALLILSSVTKDLKPNNDKLPPVLNKGVLADCIFEIDKNTKIDKKYQFDLNKMYRRKLSQLYLEENNTCETNSKWVRIPSKKHDPENFDANVEKLKTLSHYSWCTKSFNAEPYLSYGDFHIYLENGQPKLGVRFAYDEIEEIQGEKNDGTIPIEYFDELKKYINENHFKIDDSVQSKIIETEKIKTEFERIQNEIKAEIKQIQNDLKDKIEKKDAKAIFTYFGMEPEEDADGFLTISKYGRISDNYTFKDIGINEVWLFKKVKYIVGDANFKDSQLKYLDNLEQIGGNVDFCNSRVKSLGNLESIGGNADFQHSQVESLGNLESIGGSADFQYSKVENLGNLETIGGNADFQHSQVESLGNLESIGGRADFQYSKVESLGKIKTIGGNALFRYSQVENLGNLETIGGIADFTSTKIKSLDNLKSIGGDAYFNFSKIEDLGKLETIGYRANFSASQIKSLNNLKSIGENAYFWDTQIKSLGNLKSIGRDAYFQKSQIKDLGNLETIGRSVYLNECLLSEEDKKKLEAMQYGKYKHK